jgi:hypothetical protein
MKSRTITIKTSLKGAIFALAASFVLLPIAAQASCYVNGPIVRVTQYDDSYTTTGCYIYMRNSALSSYYYYTRSNDDDTCSNAVVAATTGVDTYISGNASSCPTSGTGRYMGIVNYLIINL